MVALNGPRDPCPPGLRQPAAGVWVTTGRAVVIEGPGALAVVDPGDEPWAPVAADIDAVRHKTGKDVAWIAVTHGHPDHIANLDRARAAAPAARVVAHAASPVAPDLAVAARSPAPWGGEVIPCPGHSPWGDDLAFWLPASQTLLSGDLVQPKGEAWDEPFYPSPYPFFTDGDRYVASLDTLLDLPVAILVTGHREVRTGPAARRWVAVTRRAILAVRDAVAAWTGPGSLDAAAPEIYRTLCRDRSIPPRIVAERMAGRPSAFERFDRPGIAYYWARLEPSRRFL